MENGRGMVAAHVIVGGHDVIHERSKLNTCGSFHVNSTTDFGSCSQIYLPLPIFVGHDVLCTFTKYCVLNDVCLQNMAL